MNKAVKYIIRICVRMRVKGLLLFSVVLLLSFSPNMFTFAEEANYPQEDAVICDTDVSYFETEYSDEALTDIQTDNFEDIDLSDEVIADEEVLHEEDQYGTDAIIGEQGLIEDFQEDALEDVGEELEINMDVIDPFSQGVLENESSMRDFQLFASSQNEGVTESTFDISYGQQLSGMASVFYDAMVEHYIVQRGTGDWTISWPSQDGSYEIEVDDLSAYNSSAQWKVLSEQMKYDAQSAINAFGYDYPQVFWERIYSTSWTFQTQPNHNNDGGLLQIKALKLKTKEAYTGSREDIDEFFTVVEQVASQILSASDYSGDGICSEAELVRGAHDYTVNRLWYDSTTLSLFKRYPDDTEAFRIFTPAPSFISSLNGGGVCEAYARTLKVLLDKMGIVSCLISGDDHMWNGVWLNGTWYLTDTTSDDTGAGTGLEYLLAGADRRHLASGRLTGTDMEQEFATPTISWTMYHEFGEWIVTNNATCRVDGEKTRSCFICGFVEAEAVTNGEHSFSDWTITKKATCIEEGERTRTCSGCGKNETEMIPIAEHTWDNGTIAKEPTTTSEGTRIYTCTVCSEIKTESITKISASSSIQTPQQMPAETITIGKKPTSVKAKASKKSKVTVSWKKFKKTKKTKVTWKKIKKIEVQYSTDKSFSAVNTKRIQIGKNKTKYTLKGLRKNATYYVRIRYSDGDGGYSKWSSIKKVKTKKK